MSVNFLILNHNEDKKKQTKQKQKMIKTPKYRLLAGVVLSIFEDIQCPTIFCTKQNETVQIILVTHANSFSQLQDKNPKNPVKHSAYPGAEPR
jgi:hypothetical protein